jgi:hypothetical protein
VLRLRFLVPQKWRSGLTLHLNGSASLYKEQQAGKVPHFLFGPFSFVNNGSLCCEQAPVGSIISAPSGSLRQSCYRRGG